MMELLVLPVLMIVLYFGPRLLGMGRCMDCRRGIAPWDAYCWDHSPLNPANRPPL